MGPCWPLSPQGPAESVMRCEDKDSGDMLHIDTRMLWSIVRPTHQVTGGRRDSVEGTGRETLFVAIVDRACIKRLLTDSSAAFRWKVFAAACEALDVRQKLIRSHRP